MSKIHPHHNTYLFTGPSSVGARAICQAIETVLSVPIQGNPDFWHGVYAQFTIDDSRELKERLSTKPFGERRVAIVETLTMTTEAQQAILKLAEELPKETFLFLLVPTTEQLLPTLRSRFIHITLNENGNDTATGQKFLAATWGERAKQLEKITKDRDTRRAFELLLALEAALLAAPSRDARGLDAVIVAKRRVLEGIIPLKTTMESASLALPMQG